MNIMHINHHKLTSHISTPCMVGDIMSQRPSKTRLVKKHELTVVVQFFFNLSYQVRFVYLQNTKLAVRSHVLLIKNGI